MARSEFGAKVKAAALKRADGKCEGCGQPLKAARYQFDHDVPDGLGGKPTLENCRVLCSGGKASCHHLKTHEQDTPRMTKADNQRKAHQGLKPPPKAKLPTKHKEPKVGKLLPPRRSLYADGVKP